MESRLAWNDRLTRSRSQLSLAAPVDADTQSKADHKCADEASFRNYRCRIVLFNVRRRHCIQIDWLLRLLYSCGVDSEPAFFSLLRGFGENFGFSNRRA